jgi:hypothetical protein
MARRLATERQTRSSAEYWTAVSEHLPPGSPRLDAGDVTDLTGGRDASALNTELTKLLVDSGRRMGFDVRTEYVVPGGRLDVVWLWSPPTPIPGVDDALPVVAFEVESSWRTRKHVKGDLLNLQDAAVSLGVIVLAGADAKDASLRRFAVSLVDRPGSRVAVWTQDDVRALAAGDPTTTAVAEAAAAAAAATAQTETDSPGNSGGVEHTGRYRPLWAWLRNHERREVRLAFAEIERAMGMALPESSRAHVAHWHSYQGSAVARAIIDAGWHASLVDLSSGMVTLAPGPPPGRI